MAETQSPTEIEFGVENKDTDIDILRKGFDRNITFKATPDFFGLDEGEISFYKSTASLFEKIRENPSVILEMPYLPIRDKAHTSAIEIREEEKLLSGMNDDEKSEYLNSNYNEWFKNLGFDPEALETDINLLYGLGRVMGFSGNMNELLGKYDMDWDNNAEVVQHYSFRKVMEVLRLCMAGELYVSKIKNEAIDVMRQAAPEIVPSKPIELVYMPTHNAVGQYQGIFAGHHYIGVRTNLVSNPYFDPLDPEMSETKSRDISSVVHEATHAYQAETRGEENYFYIKNPLESVAYVSDNPTPREIFFALEDANSMLENHREATDFTLILNIYEGSAILAQMMSLNQMIENAKTDKEKQAVEKSKRKIIMHLRFRDDYDRPDEDNKEASYRYRDGVALLRPLYHEFGMSKLPDILKRINYDECSKIKVGSKEYEDIVRNPKLIPGISEVSV